MLFCPTLEFRINKDRTKLTGALCGLGYNKDLKMNLCGDFDIENVFEVAFSDNDFKWINATRTAINMMIGDEEKAKEWMNNPESLKTLQKDNYDMLKKLISHERKSVDPEHFDYPYKWNRLQANVYEQDLSKNTLYKNHARVKLRRT